jgi:microcystin degradation protein MlrC
VALRSQRFTKEMAPQIGLEPTTLRLTVVRSSNFKNLATQMTTHGHAWTRKVTSNVTLI